MIIILYKIFSMEFQIKINRSKESSWSYKAEVSRSFAYGMASSSINVLVKYVAKPSDIVIDFTMLSEHDKKLFKFRHQNEVILDIGKYDATINDIWISKNFEEYLRENPIYKFKKRFGFSN